jgi:hypothetical protein
MRIASMGHDKIRYLVYSKGRWRWQPTKAMRKHGFQNVKLSKGGPELNSSGYPAARREDKLKAVEMNAAWDAVMLGLPAPAPQKPVMRLGVYPEGSVGDGYKRAMALRKAGRVAKGVVWTIEQEKRDSWPRSWKWLEPRFADCDPRTIEPEHFLRVGPESGEPSGLVPEIEKKVSINERHMVIKVWRAFVEEDGRDEVLRRG